MTEWKEEHCSQQPAEVEAIADGFLLQRRNIRSVVHDADEDAGTEAYTEWVCESREITITEYQLQHKAEMAEMNEAIDDLTVSILMGGLF